MSKYPESITAEEVASALKSQIVGKVVLITGVNLEGLGYETARAIALQNPALLILAGHVRTTVEVCEKKIKEQMPNIHTRIVIFDLADNASVRKGAAEINAYPETVDVLINNAGVMAAPYKKTVDGLETHFAVNYAGHFLLSNLLIPKMIKNGGGRIVSVTSDGYCFSGIRFDDINFEVSSVVSLIAVLDG